MNTLFNTLLDILFPSSCLVCGKAGPDLCRSCLSRAPQAERECELWIFPVFDYRHPPIKKAIHLLKYSGKKNLGFIFAESLYPRMLEELADLTVMENFTDPVLIPIPLSPKRKRERGFNQAEIICKALLELDADGNNFTFSNDLLSKPADTIHQAHLENRTERLKNLVGSFRVKNQDLIKDRNIILIDDVTTTGATLREARKTLRRAGARRVIAFTVAH